MVFYISQKFRKSHRRTRNMPVDCIKGMLVPPHLCIVSPIHTPPGLDQSERRFVGHTVVENFNEQFAFR